jgi:hypothetical protein
VIIKMNKKLNNVIEKSLRFSKFYKDKNIDEDEEAKFSFEAARDKTAKEIYQEIRSEVRQEEIDKAQEEIENQKLIHKIKELRTLTIIGIIIAFFVGMAVNQVTGLFVLLDFFKKWYGMLIILAISIVIVMSIINYWILKEEKK